MNVLGIVALTLLAVVGVFSWLTVIGGRADYVGRHRYTLRIPTA
jgi:hypothetical protein